MIRVFSARGYGLSDEQFLMVAFGKDLVTKGAQLYTFKKSLTQSLKMMTEMYNAQVNPEFNASAQGATGPRPQSPPPQSPPPKPQSPPPSPPNPTPEPEAPAPLREEEVFGGLPKKGGNIQPIQETVEEEMMQNQEEATMHDDMEDEITVSPKRRRGRPKKKIRLEPTEEESKTTIIEATIVDDVDLNKGFDMSDAMETEEK